MLRINADLLIEKDELNYYREELFTGIAFFVNLPFIEKVKEYYQGKCIGPYISKWLDNDQSIIRVEVEELDGDGEHQQAFFEGKPFNGISYDLDGGFCHEESDYQNGWIGQDITFYADGIIDSITLMNEVLSEEVLFHRKGFVEEYRLNKFKIFNVKFLYTEQALRSVRLNGDFLNLVNEDEYLLNIEVPDTLEKIKKIKIHSTLNLFGSGITDEFVEAIMHNDGLKETNDIFISDTSLSLSTIITIIHQTNLVRLWIDNKNTDVLLELPSVLQKLKVENPQCDIRFNDEKII
jgi:hypothetical protein